MKIADYIRSREQDRIGEKLYATISGNADATFDSWIVGGGT